MKRILLLFCLLFLVGCDASPEKAESSAILMGTYVTVTLYGENKAQLQAAADGALGIAEEMESVFSFSDPGSELSCLNQSGQGTVSETLWNALEIAVEYEGLSEGALCCTMGKLIDLWGIGTDHAAVPDAADISFFVPAEDAVLLLDEENRRVQLADPDVQLHLGAVAKGYAADRMAQYLRDAGVSGGALNLGGNVLTFGEAPDGEHWTVGIADPFAPDDVLMTLTGNDMSVVTSGGYERYFEEDGIRYHHILDPKTGYPAQSGLESVTIIGNCSAQCDALSTAVFVMGAQRGMELVESLDGVEAVLVTGTGELLFSSGMDAYRGRS